MNKKPNILIIHADQHRWDCLGAYGNKEIRTPNIDNLARDGVLYRNSFCPFPVCTPSRYSLISGLYVHQHMGYSNHCTLPPALDTFPKILRSGGYKTKAVGKMHFTPTYLDVGFDEMVLSEQDGPGRHDDDYHRWLREQGLVDGIDLMDQVKEYRDQAPQEYWDKFGAVRSDLGEEHHSTTWIAERAMETIKDWDEEGNLLMVGFIKPHHPFDPPAPWDAMYNPEELTLLPGWTDTINEIDTKLHPGYFPYEPLNKEQLEIVMAHYYASISQIDHHVGRIVDALKEKGLYDNTLIIYTSDHGDYMGYRHLLLKGGYMYDPLVKVPLIVKYPGSLRAGEVNEGLVSNIDMGPTILSLAGCEYSRSMSGLDMTKEIEGHNMVFCEDGRQFMVRSKKRKLLYFRDSAKCQFFNLENDPLEMENLYNHPDYQEEIIAYRLALGDWMMLTAPTPVYLNEDAPVIEKENVPSKSDRHREDSDCYYRECMVDAGNRIFTSK